MLVCSACGNMAAATQPCNKGCGMDCCDKKCQKAHYRAHKWFDTYHWYDQPMVLHYQPNTLVGVSVEHFVGVYIPTMSVQESAAGRQSMPSFELHEEATRSLFNSYQVLGANEQLYRREHGLWLNETPYWERRAPASPYPIELFVCDDFSIRVHRNRYATRVGETLVRVAKQPPPAISALSKMMTSDTDRLVHEFHGVMEETFDEWRLIDSNSKVVGTATVALTPMDLFLRPILTHHLSTHEWLCQRDSLFLCIQGNQIDSLNQTPPQNWLNTIPGVYTRKEGFVYGNLKGPHIGWLRNREMTRRQLHRFGQVDPDADRDLCLYYCEVTKQFVVRPLLADGSMKEDCHPEMISTRLPARDFFDLDDLEHLDDYNDIDDFHGLGGNIESIWTGHLMGEGEWTIPTVLAPREEFMVFQVLKTYRETYQEAPMKSVLSQSTLDGTLDETSDEARGGHLKGGPEPAKSLCQAEKKKKRKRKKKKKKKGGEETVSHSPDTVADEPPAIDSNIEPAESSSKSEKPELVLETSKNQEQANGSAEVDDESRTFSEPFEPDTGSSIVSKDFGAEAAGMHAHSKSTSIPSQGSDTTPNETGLQDLRDQQQSRDNADVSNSVEQIKEISSTVDHKTSIKNICHWLSHELASKATALPSDDLTSLGFDTTPSICSVAQWLFDPRSKCHGEWVHAQDSMTAAILEKILQPADHLKEQLETTSLWLQQNGTAVLQVCVERSRMKDMIALIGSHKAVPFVTVSVVCRIFGNLPDAKGGTELGNKLARQIAKVQLDSMSDFKTVQKCAARKLSKDANIALKVALRKGERDLRKRQQAATRKSQSTPSSSINGSSETKGTANDGGNQYEMPQSNAAQMMKEDVRRHHQRIDSSMKWYIDKLERLQVIGIDNVQGRHPDHREDAILESNSSPRAKELSKSTTSILTADQIAIEIAKAMARCSELPADKAEEELSNLELSLDLSNWSIASEWVVEITEQAHKWFRKRSKKQHHLCERVLRRMQLLSTGRWPYVLCKPVRTSKKASINLYESKIDAASRILWEVAVSFSPRRSSEGKFFSEQVIRVWDIVEDHDNLTRAIDRAIERIEKSHVRGRECMVFSQLEGFDGNSPRDRDNGTNKHGGTQVIPKVFRMQQGIQGQEQPKEGIYYAPASDDEKQFNLLKFYEMNKEAVELLLADKTDVTDLPFTPGPLEHEIIHYHPEPKRSILLMGRSGTGKTTCLVFRMWAEYMADENKQPRQLFLTKNNVLRTEVERSFKSMGLAWRKRVSNDIGGVGEEHNTSFRKDKANDIGLAFPLFLTSSEWLDMLDSELPGEHFFTNEEMKQRLGSREEDDAVQRGMEDFFGNEKSSKSDGTLSSRREMTFGRFCQLWPKINSSLKTTMDPALVWLEIKSHIKGCVAALHLDHHHRSKTDRFLSRDEYLALPRKQSRIDQRLRKMVYDLYVNYERLKRGKYYDEMDIAYNLARRIPSHVEEGARLHRLFPVDAVFVDEVQDFTQSELFLVAKLCNDPNNLMLAGDTAQSIAVGVGFRFTDVRQIFFNSFGGIEPRLLQLTHNYRSHSGILQLAASVVELLYFFFSDGLDKLPPDFGLFPGPKPVLMQVSSLSDLVLMLDGSKRETSRIEFGAHQVVIVRNEEAKKALPEEFGVDKDWVMTVHESKGLEFDDVLLLNFFGDSPAGDSWRVVSNYTIEEAKKYREESAVSSSPLHRFEWEEVAAHNNTRHLAFNHESHKILETELKMLYTAITRARVNVFIAEMDVSTCQPMFDYFRQRQLVESIQKDDSKGLSGLRVFGQMNTVEEWRKRGQYYLEKSVGQKENVGALRLAAKCFEKAGERKKMRHALAYVEFIKMEEKSAEIVGKKRAQGIERKQRLYSIAADLLEAEDIEFLSKAGLCLMRTGPAEYARSAKILDMYARIRYAMRLAKEQTGDNRPSHHEQQHFSYASQLYSRCISDKGRQSDERGSMIVDAFRCCISSGKEDDLERASQLLENHSEHCRNVILDLTSIWHGSEGECASPTKDWIACLQGESEAFEKVKKAMMKIACIACRSFHAKNDERGLAAAVSVVPSRGERIQLLSSLDNDAVFFVRNALWGSAHPAFRRRREGVKKGKNETKSADATQLLCRELLSDGDFDAAADVLEVRGRLLEAAECLSKKSGAVNRDRIFQCKVLYVELMLGCVNAQSQQREKESLSELLKSLQQEFEEAGTSLPLDARMAFVISKAKYTSEGEEDLYQVSEMSKVAPILWKLESFQLVMEKKTNVEFNDNAKDVWARHLSIVSISRDLRNLIGALRRGNQEDVSSVSQAYSFFQLKPCPSDPRSLLTKVVTNWRLRTALRITDEQLPSSSTFDSNSLTVAIDESKINDILAHYCCHLGFELLKKFEECLRDETLEYEICPHLRCGLTCNCTKRQHKSKVVLVTKQADYLQSSISCLEEMKTFIKLGKELCHKDSEWMSRLKKVKGNRDACLEQLAGIIHDYVDIPVLRFEDIENEPTFDSIIIRGQAITASLLEHSQKCWYNLRRREKKTCLVQTIKLWRMLNICYEDENECLKIFDQKLKVLEHNQKKTDFIRSKTIVKGGKVKPVKLLFRQWMWAVESAKENVFNSVTLVERLLKMTGEKPYLETLPHAYQLSMLETNCVTLFSLISYRYSDVSSKDLWLALPEKRYLRFHLLGEGRNPRTLGRGFGIRLIDTLRCVENGDHFFNFFGKFVTHLEALASLIIKGGLLSCSKFVTAEAASPDDIQCFERAIILCSCIIYNVVALSNVGRVMNRSEASNDLNVLPRLPLGGSIGGICIYLRDTLVQLEQVPHPPSLLVKLARGLNKTSSLIDLVQVTHKILEQALSDRFVLFRIERDNENDSIVMNRNETDSYIWFSKIWQAFEKKNTSPAESRRTNDELSFVLASDPLPCQEFLPVDSHQQVDESIDLEMDDMHDFSRISDRRDAAMAIQRLFRRRTNNAIRVSYFRWWKKTMTHLARLITAKIEARRRNVLLEGSAGLAGSADDGEALNPLESFPNLYQDLRAVADSKAKWRQWVTENIPFFDGVQCEFCHRVLETHLFETRQSWCKSHCANVPYKVAAEKFNLEHYQTQWVVSPMLSYHLQSPAHRTATEVVFDLVDALPPLYSRVEISIRMLENTINACQKETARGDSKTSWYLMCREESRIRNYELEVIMGQMREFYLHRQFEKLQSTMAMFRDISFRTQAYLEEKRDQEKQFILEQRQAASLEEESDTNDNDENEHVEEHDFALGLSQQVKNHHSFS